MNVRARDAHKLGALPVVARREARARGRCAARSRPTGGPRAAGADRRSRGARAAGSASSAPTWRPRDGERMTPGAGAPGAQRGRGPGRPAGRRLRHAARGRPQALGREPRPALPHGGRLLVHGRRDPGRARRAHGAAATRARSTSVIGDGTWLMGSTGELVTARQEGLKLTILRRRERGLPVDPRAPARPAPGGASGSSSASATRRRADGPVRGGRLRRERAQPRLRRAIVASSLDELRDGARGGARRDAAGGDRRRASSRAGSCSTPAAGGTSACAEVVGTRPRRASWRPSTRAAGRFSGHYG